MPKAVIARRKKEHVMFDAIHTGLKAKKKLLVILTEMDAEGFVMLYLRHKYPKNLKRGYKELMDTKGSLTIFTPTGPESMPCAYDTLFVFPMGG